MAASSQLSDDKRIVAVLRCERIQRIIAWLLEHEDQIAELEKVQITFDCAGRSVKATKKQIESI